VVGRAALMVKRVTWLSDTEWARIEPLLPHGRRGAHRVDDRRVISGIVHMLRSGARWRDSPPQYGPYTTIYNRFNRWSRQGIWNGIFEALTGRSPVFGTIAIDATHIKAHRSAAGAKGGLQPSHRPVPWQAPSLIGELGPFTRLIADRGCDSNDIRALIAARGAEALIPPSSIRVRQIPYDRIAYRARNLVERLWCRLKDWRRIATRYDKLATNFLSGVLIAAAFTCWCY
jgi:transposase